MTSLQQLQQAFMAELSGEPSEAFRAVVKNNTLNGTMDKARRIDIYRRNHLGSRGNGLANTYPVCRQILGEQTFDRLAEDYVASFPSAHWDLNFNGKDFDQFLASSTTNFPQLAELFYLADLARLEWAFHWCYFADANSPGAVCQVKNQDPERLHFVADSSLQCFCSTLPVFQIWHNNRQGAGEQAVADEQPMYYHLVYREALIPQVYTLSGSQYRLIGDCIAGRSLAELAETHGEIVAENIPLFIQYKWLFLSQGF